ncbi:MAG TPA: hypothetical protein VIF62_19170, partial [Labilithrix sp.]
MGGRRAAFVAIACAAAAACNALNGSGDLDLCASDCVDAALPDVQPADVVAPPPPPPPGDDAGMPRLGTGRSGPLTVPAGTAMTVGTNAAITSAVAAGDRVVKVDATTGFASGDLVMLWRTSGYVGATTGAIAAVALDGSAVGHYELARVVAVDVMTLTLESAAASAYPVVASQVVRVPEYTDVTISAGATMHGSPWDGSKGGIVAFLATGVVTIDGALGASGAGFRGGVGVRVGGFGNCALLDGTPATGYAAKGEGIALGGYTTDADGGGIGGRGNLANGAGGGDCHNGAGAGGGHGGAGGAGANGNVGTGGIGGAGL